jgi:hypothetical protein
LCVLLNDALGAVGRHCWWALLVGGPGPFGLQTCDTHLI